MMDCIKSINELPNTILFPGSLVDSTYFPSSYPRYHRNVKLIFIPMFPNDLTNSCLHNCRPIRMNVPTYLPAILILKDNDDNDTESPFKHHETSSRFIIHFHSNAADAGNVKYFAERESESYDANYLIVEYPRYGFASGNPSEEALNHIALRVYDHVTTRLMVPPNRIVLYGRSIGTGLACYLASYVQRVKGHKLAALILHSPFTSLVNVAADILGPCIFYCMLDRFPNWKLLTGDPRADTAIIRCPVLFLHADCDLIVDYEHSRVLHERRLHFHLPSKLHTQRSSPGKFKGHNFFNFSIDIMRPIQSFLSSLRAVSDINSQYTIPMEEIEQMMIVPKEYGQLTECHKYPKISVQLICRWSCILCTQPMECLAASVGRSCDVMSSALLGESPQSTFVYRTKAMRGESHDSCCGILYTLITERSLKNVANENEISFSKLYLERNKMETQNPLFDKHKVSDSSYSQGIIAMVPLSLSSSSPTSPKSSSSSDYTYSSLPSDIAQSTSISNPLQTEIMSHLDNEMNYST